MQRILHALGHVRSVRACTQGRNGETNIKKEKKKNNFVWKLTNPFFLRIWNRKCKWIDHKPLKKYIRIGETSETKKIDCVFMHRTDSFTPYFVELQGNIHELFRFLLSTFVCSNLIEWRNLRQKYYGIIFPLDNHCENNLHVI